MENKTKIETTTPTSIYQQPLENNRKIKTALTTNNQWKTKQKQKQYQCLPIAIRRQQKNKTELTTNNQWKTKQKQKQHQVFTNSHQKTTEK